MIYEYYVVIIINCVYSCKYILVLNYFRGSILKGYKMGIFLYISKYSRVLNFLIFVLINEVMWVFKFKFIKIE